MAKTPRPGKGLPPIQTDGDAWMESVRLSIVLAQERLRLALDKIDTDRHEEARALIQWTIEYLDGIAQTL